MSIPVETTNASALQTRETADQLNRMAGEADRLAKVFIQ